MTRFTGASFKAAGGFCLETGVHGRYTLIEEETTRIGREATKTSCWLPINVTGLLGMVMTAFLMIVIRNDRPASVGGAVLMRRDRVLAV